MINKKKFEKMFNTLINWLEQEDVRLIPEQRQRLFENITRVWLTFQEDYCQWTPLERLIWRIYFLNPRIKINKGRLVMICCRTHGIDNDEKTEKLTRELNGLLLKIWNEKKDKKER